MRTGPQQQVLPSPRTVRRDTRVIAVEQLIEAMQIIESSLLGLRSARLVLAKPNSSIEVTLFPMVHVGEPAFFARVYRDAFNHDTALVEGINSPIGHRITRSYRWITGAKRLGLIVQPRYPEPRDVHAKIIWADLSATEFATVWRSVTIMAANCDLRCGTRCWALAQMLRNSGRAGGWVNHG